MMAEAWGKITGEPGICFVTRGPGARQCHERPARRPAGLDAHGALRRPAPFAQFEDREAFQEIDTKRLLGSLREMGRRHPPDRAHPRVREPRLSTSRAPAGRVRSCWACPRTCWRPTATAADAKRGARIADCRPGRRGFGRAPAAAWPRRQRPLLIVGGPAGARRPRRRWRPSPIASICPSRRAFRYQDYIDNRHRCYVGCAGIGIEPSSAPPIKNCRPA